MDRLMVTGILEIMFLTNLLLGVILFVLLIVMVFSASPEKKVRKNVKEDLGKIKDQINGE